MARQPIDLESDSAKAGIRYLLEKGTVLDPSLARGEEGGHWRAHYELVEPGVLRVPLELRGPLQSTGVDSARAAAAVVGQNRTVAILKALRDAGVPIVWGTDLTVPGFSIYREMELARFPTSSVPLSRSRRMARAGTMVAAWIASMGVNPPRTASSISR